MPKNYEEWKNGQEKKTEEKPDFKPVLLKNISDSTRYDFIWDGVIAKGHGTLLSCLAKAGKSTFIRCFLRALYDEEEFLGLPTQKCNILIITEENLSDWKLKAPEFGLDVEDFNLWLIKPSFYGKPTSKVWTEFITERVLTFCLENDINLVIVDTLSRFWAVDNENDASQANHALSPFESLKDKNIAVLVIQQGNKAGGAFGRSIRGSTEITGWADEVIIFSRVEGQNQKSRLRQIDFYGRLYDSEDKLIIKLDNDNSYLVEATKTQYSKQARIDIILKIFDGSSIPLTIKQVRNLWDEMESGNKPSDDTILRYINDLVDLGLLRLVDYEMSNKRKTPKYGLAVSKYSEQIDLTSQTKVVN